MTEPLKGFVHSTESFGSVDGPGIRFIIFMQGCRMRCQFCHNPDTWNIGGGNEMTSDELLNMALQYKPFWGQKGGITVSGGEPLLQIDFLIELFTKAKAQGVHTTLDTCGLPFTYDEPFFSQFNKLLAVTDLILLGHQTHRQPEAQRIDNVAERKHHRTGEIFVGNQSAGLDPSRADPRADRL